MLVEKTHEQLAREEVQRQALEDAARKVEALSGNQTYRQAFRVAARAVRAMKP